MGFTATTLQLDYAVKNARKNLIELRSHFERMISEIDNKVASFDRAEDTARQAEVLGFAVSYFSSNNSPRLDLVASSMVELSSLAMRARLADELAGLVDTALDRTEVMMEKSGSEEQDAAVIRKNLVEMQIKVHQSRITQE